jgi:hypothetical protein
MTMNKVDVPERPSPTPASGASTSSVAFEMNAICPPARVPQAGRSQVLGQFRTNPFRVLRVRPDVGVDEAVWKSEEALTRLRAGVALSDGELVPWISEPDEPEIRQAVQRIEEPLRRLTDQLFWFDPEHDCDGELLRQALRELDPKLINDYLPRGALEVIPRSSTPCTDPPRVVVTVTYDTSAPEVEPQRDGCGRGEAYAEVAAGELPRLLNHANLRLLLAALSLFDALPSGVYTLSAPGDTEKASDTINWSMWRGLEVCENPHTLELTMGQRVFRLRQTAGLWNDALAHWLRIVNAPAFLAFVQASIARLEDDVVGADDAEVIVNSVTARLLDLLVGEVKVQHLAGRNDRVRALLEAAANSAIEPRRWGPAFRPLRPLFRTEAAELEPLLVPGDLGFNDCELYLARLKRLRERWAALDPTGLLGLDEIGDEAVVKACESLGTLESYSAVDRLKGLYGTAMGLASADSLKQRIAAVVSRINGFEHYACHFCKTREMDLQKSVVIKGKRESHRTHGFNSTTIHFTVKANVIPRCGRCSDLHAYFWKCGSTGRQALGVALVAGFAYLVWAKAFGTDAELGGFLLFAGAAALLVWLTGLAVSPIAAILATPRGERRYWRSRTAKAYREMESEGFKLTVDYSRDAFQVFKREQAVQGS